jgi:hypothetical protein
MSFGSRAILICLTLLGCGVGQEKDDTIFCFLDKQKPRDNPFGRYSCLELEGTFTEEFAKPFMEMCGANARPGDPAGWTSIQGHGRCPRMVTALGGCQTPFPLQDDQGNVGRFLRRYPQTEDCAPDTAPTLPPAPAGAAIDYTSAFTAP